MRNGSSLLQTFNDSIMEVIVRIKEFLRIMEMRATWEKRIYEKDQIVACIWSTLVKVANVT